MARITNVNHKQKPPIRSCISKLHKNKVQGLRSERKTILFLSYASNLHKRVQINVT